MMENKSVKNYVKPQTGSKEFTATVMEASTEKPNTLGKQQNYQTNQDRKGIVWDE